MTYTITTDIIRARLREARLARSLTLKDIEIKTNGELKAVTLGTWERGTRMLSVQQLLDLCELYEITPELIIRGVYL